MVRSSCELRAQGWLERGSSCEFVSFDPGLWVFRYGATKVLVMARYGRVSDWAHGWSAFRTRPMDGLGFGLSPWVVQSDAADAWYGRVPDWAHGQSGFRTRSMGGPGFRTGSRHGPV